MVSILCSNFDSNLVCLIKNAKVVEKGRRIVRLSNSLSKIHCCCSVATKNISQNALTRETRAHYSYTNLISILNVQRCIKNSNITYFRWTKTDFKV